MTVDIQKFAQGCIIQGKVGRSQANNEWWYKAEFG